MEANIEDDTVAAHEPAHIQPVSLPVDHAVRLMANDFVESAVKPIESILNETFLNHRDKIGRNIHESPQARLFGEDNLRATSATAGDICLFKDTGTVDRSRVH